MKTDISYITELQYCGQVVKLGPYFRHKFNIIEDFETHYTVWNDMLNDLRSYTKELFEDSKGNTRCTIVINDDCSLYALNDFIKVLYDNGTRDIWIYFKESISDSISRSAFHYLVYDDDYNIMKDLDMTYVFGEYQSEHSAMVIDGQYITPVYRASFNQQIWKVSNSGVGYINVTNKLDPYQSVWETKNV